jgi:hypothetical protein
VLGVLFSWLLGVFLFHKGVIGDATLFGFPLYGVLPGLIVGGVGYAVLSWQVGFKIAHNQAEASSALAAAPLI